MQTKIRSLNWLGISTRPDITTVITMLKKIKNINYSIVHIRFNFILSTQSYTDTN